MAYIIIALLLLLALAACVAVFLASPKRPNHYSDLPRRKIALAVGGVVAALLLVLTLLCSVARVGPREVGIETALGKYSRTLNAGWQVQAPWANVETFSTQLQRTELDAPVAFASSGGGTQHAVVQWKITDTQAEDLWKRYKTFDNVQSMLVDPSTRQAVGDVLAGYSPAEARAEGAGEKIRAEVEKSLRGALSKYGVELDSVAMPPTALDDTAQGAYNRVVEARANVDRAKEDVDRAKLDAEANKLRNKELTPENLVDQCLTTTNNWDHNKNGELPASWNCMSGGNTQLVTPTK